MARKVVAKEIVVKYKADTKDFVKHLKNIDKHAKQTSAAMLRMEKRMNSFMSAIRNITGLYFAAKGLIELSKAFLDAADSMKFFELQAQALSGSAQGFNDIFLAAQESRIGLAAMMKQVNIFTPALKKLGVSFKGSISFIQDLTKSLRFYGVQGEAARNSTIQLAQAFSSGRLQGDELRSISENAGGLYSRLEDIVQQMLGTQKGLRDLGTEGVLSADIMYDAFNKVFVELRDNFEDLPQTVAQTVDTVRNEFILLASAIDREFNISDVVISAMELLRDASKALRQEMDDFRGTGFEEALDVQRQKAQELASVQVKLQQAHAALKESTKDTANVLETLSLESAAAAAQVLYFSDRAQELQESLDVLSDITKTAAGDLTDAGQFADAAGDSMARMARDVDTLGDALTDLQMDAADAAAELAALRVGGLAALEVQRQFNQESRFLDTGEDPAEAALQTGVERMQEAIDVESDILRAAERARASAAARASKGGGGGGRRKSAGGGGGKSAADQAAEDLQKLLDKLEPMRVTTEKFNAEMALLTGNFEVGGERFKVLAEALGEDYVDAIDSAQDSTKKLNDEQNKAQEFFELISGDVGNTFNALIAGTKGWSDALGDLAKSLVNAITQLLVIKPLIAGIESGLGGFSFFGGSTQAAPGRAIGGPVAANQPYMVGERGPEMFIPRGSGTISSKPQVNVQVNTLPGTSANVRETEQGLTIDIVEMHVASALASGGNPISKAAESAYPTLRRGTR